MQAFCTSALHRAMVPCDSMAFLFIVGMPHYKHWYRSWTLAQHYA